MIDNSYGEFCAAGSNYCGGLGIGFNRKSKSSTFQPITYFEKNQVIINKVCRHVDGDCTFFISDKRELYGCGKNLQNKNGLETLL